MNSLNEPSFPDQHADSKIVAVNFVKLFEEPNPHLQLDCIVRNSHTGEDIRHATAEFWLESKDTTGKSRQVWDVSLVDHSNLPSTDEPSQNAASLKFNYAGAVVSGVDQIPADWPLDVKDSITRLAVYRTDGVATIPLTTLIGGSPQQVLRYLQDYQPNRLWKPYMDSKPRVSWDELDKLYGEEGPLMVNYPVPQHESRCHFSSPEEALVKLSVGRYIEQKWEEKMFRELCRGYFGAAFFILGPAVAIACVRRKDLRIVIDKNALWDDHMKIVMKFETMVPNSWAGEGQVEKTIRMTGHVVSNQTDVECEIVVLLDHIPGELYDLARPLGHPPTFIDLDDFDIEVIDQPAQRQIESLNAFFDRDNPIFSQWWPMMLAQDGSGVARFNFLHKLGWTQQDFKQVHNKIVERMRDDGKPLNQEQMSILLNASYSRAGFNIIRGPPGCGKTTLIAMLAQLFLGAPDTAVMVLAGSNGSTDRSFDTLDRWMRDDGGLDERQLPLRAHKKYVEFTHFRNEFDPSAKQGRKVAAEKKSARVLGMSNEPLQFGFYERQQEAEYRKHMNDPSKGVGAAVMTAVRDNELPAAPASGNLMSQQIQAFHLVEAEKSLSVLQSQRSRLSKGERLDVKFDIKEAFDSVSRYIIGTRRLIVSTVGNATSTMLQDCIFRDAKHVIVIIDEGGLQTDV